MLGSLLGVVAALLLLGAAFRLAETSSPTFVTDPTQASCPLPQAQALTCTSCVRQVGACHPLHLACPEPPCFASQWSVLYVSGVPAHYDEPGLVAPRALERLLA